jgi:serine/threonine protein kinase
VSIAAENGTPFHSIGFLQHRSGDLIKGRYEVLSRLGGGNFGSVYRVRDTAVGVELACKEMHVLNNPATAADERAAALELFKREALNLATVRHPHIPAAYFEQENGTWNVCPLCGFDYDNADLCPLHGAQLLPVEERFYLMMDFIDGPTLEELAENESRDTGRPLDETPVLEWTAQIASALRALHRVGIVHRDIKPENIKIRSEDNVAILLDFGLTRKSEEAGSYGTVRQSGTGRLGTPGYAPPNLQELARPEPRSDIYALGMTVYRLLTGRDPQDQGTLQEMRAQTPRFFNQSLSPATEQIVLRATRADANERYSSIDDLLGDLHEIVAPTGRTHVAPFTFADGTRARSPLDLARLVEGRREEAANYLFNGLLGQWLVSGGFAPPAHAAEEAIKRFPNHPQRALEHLRRALYPANAIKYLPEIEIEPDKLEFGNVPSGASQWLELRIRNTGRGFAWGRLSSETESSTLSATANPLAGLNFPAEWDGDELTIEIELDTGRVANGEYFGYLVVTLEGVREVQRVPVHYSVQALSLRVEPKELNFGTLLVGEVSELPLRIVQAESSAGRPRGTIYVNSDAGPVTAPERFEGDEPFNVMVDGSRLEAIARPYHGNLQIDTNGGRLRVPLRFTLSLPLNRLLGLVAGYVFCGVGGAAFARVTYGLVNPVYLSRWLTQGGTLSPPEVLGYGTPIALGALIGVAYEILRVSREEERPLAHPAQRWWQNPVIQGVFLSGVLGAVLCWPLLWIGHWAFWGFGDWLLRPLSIPPGGLSRWLGMDASNNAPVVWALAGGVAGLVAGVARVLRIRGHEWARYGAWLVYALLFLMVFINAMVSVGL